MTRAETQRLAIALLLFVASQTAEARRIPTEPVQLSDSDEEEIVRVLGLTSEQIRSIHSYRYPGSSGVDQGTRAIVAVAEGALAPRVEAIREVPCYEHESEWICTTERSTEMLYVDLPEECPAEVAQGIAWPAIRMYGDPQLSVAEALAMVELICTSEEMADQAWNPGHRVSFALRNHDGALEVRTVSPRSDAFGMVFELEGECTDDTCELGVKRVLGWRT